MELPKALAPWGRYLAIFPPEVARSLGPLVRRLAAAVGPLRAHGRAASGEPDGFAGLASRGPYERLLASEWLLADEAPDEFARRAAMGEHVFLHLARREPVRSRASLAIFDAGPNQLGAPRVAHVAALVVLARRAEAAGAAFGWGVLQQPDLPVFSEVTANDVMRLLKLRSAREATAADVEGWCERADAWQGVDDVWVVGGARLDALPASGLAHLHIRDALDPHARRLAVRLCLPASAPRRLELELPDDAACTRLLRDPFGAGPGSRAWTPAAPASNLVFDPSGTKLFARAAGGGLVAYPVPNSPRAGVGRPKRFLADALVPIVAAGRFDRALMMVTAERGLARVHKRHRRYRGLREGYYRPVPAEHGFASIAGAPLQPCLRVPVPATTGVEAYAVDGAGSLFRLAERPDHTVVEDGLPIAGTAQRVALDVRAIGTIAYSVVYVARTLEGDWRIVSSGSSPARHPLPFEGAPGAVLLGFDPHRWQGSPGLVALEDSARDWHVFDGTEVRTVEPPRGARVVGIARTLGEAPRLAVLEDGDRALSLYGGGSRAPVATSRSPIVHVAACTTFPWLAYATEAGEVVLYSLGHETALCRFLPEAAEP